MKRGATYLSVAVASFALGIAVDRILLGLDDSQGEPVADGSTSGLDWGGSSRDAAPRRQSGSPRASAGRDERDRGRFGPEREGVAAELREVLEGLELGGRMDAATATGLLERVPGGQMRREVLHRLAHHWGRSDPEAALEWAQQLTGREQWETIEMMMHSWAEVDPAEAAAYAAALPNSERSLRLVRDMARRWAERDRAAALDWGLAQPEAATRERALAGVVEWWGQHEPAEAATFAAELGDLAARREVLNAAARQWASRDTEEALAWAQGLPPGDREHAASAVLRHVAEQEPQRAAVLYEEMTAATGTGSEDRHLHERMVREIAWVWSSSDPAAAAAWAVSLSGTEEVQRAAVGEVAERWLRLDSMAAGEWIRDLPAGQTRDTATERLVRNIVESDPATAFEWANSASDDGHRTGLIRDVLGRWQTTDPTAARAAFESADLPAEQRRHLGRVLGIEPSPPAAPPE